MRSLHSVLALAGALLLLAAAAPPALAGGPQVTEGTTKFVMTNDDVTIWFVGKKPTLELFPTANASAAKDDNATIPGAFTYKFLRVVEFRDLDGNGAVDANEALATLDLATAALNVSRAQSGENTTLEFVFNDTAMLADAATPATPVPLPGGVPSVVDRHANVSLAFTLRGATASVVAGAATLAVPASAVKYDFIVSQWPWLDATNDRLALVSEVSGNLTRVNGTGLESGVIQSNGTALGALAWTTAAQATSEAGAKLVVPVKTAIAASNATNMTTITHVYDAPGIRTLVHDPTIGLASGAQSMLGGGTGVTNAVKPSPGPGLVMGLISAVVGACALRARRGA